MRVWEWHGIDMYCPEIEKTKRGQITIQTSGMKVDRCTNRWIYNCASNRDKKDR